MLLTKILTDKHKKVSFSQPIKTWPKNKYYPFAKTRVCFDDPDKPRCAEFSKYCSSQEVWSTLNQIKVILKMTSNMYMYINQQHKVIQQLTLLDY